MNVYRAYKVIEINGKQYLQPIAPTDAQQQAIDQRMGVDALKDTFSDTMADRRHP